MNQEDSSTPPISPFPNFCTHCDGEGHIDANLYTGIASDECEACNGTGLKVPQQNILPAEVLTPSTKWGKSA